MPDPGAGPHGPESRAADRVDRLAGRWLESGSRLHGFQELARYSVHDILLVSSLYDAFTLTEDGQLTEGVLGGFLSFDAHHAPRVRHAATGREAIRLARTEGRYDVVIAAMHVGDMSAVDLGRELARDHPALPVIALAYDVRDLTDEALVRSAGIDRVFLWQGDVNILPAIVKYVEDRLNVATDTGEMGVQAIIIIEDGVRYYSSFLPVIYAELMRHSQSLVPEGINPSHKLMRLQARPKILLCSTFEEAWRFFSEYEENILGVIADIEFPKDGKLAADAGVEFARRVRERRPDIPIMLQSSLAESAPLAASVDAAFLIKESPTLLHQLQQFMVDNFGFGDFVFRLPDGTIVGRAADLRSLEEQLHTVPAASLAYHGERNHFSKWLKARTEFALAHRLRPRKVSDFATVEDLRQELIGAIADYRRQRARGIVADFGRAAFDPEATFCRIGGGSLGGKGRGLAFISFMLDEFGVASRFAGVRIGAPPAIVLGVEAFDRVLERNRLRDLAMESTDDAETIGRFLAATFPDDVVRDLAAYLELARYPLAVRSSSLLEDSPYQPFAGIYDTCMVPNRHASLAVRLAELQAAIARVYASTFSQRAKAYLHASPYRLEEEKMAIVIQKVVGMAHGDRYYPDVSGVARSHNYYPLPPLRAEDGIAAVALGLGTTVAIGETCFRFSPAYPRHVTQFSSVEDVLQNSQRAFYAVRLDGGGARPAGAPAPFEPDRFELDAAERDGTLAIVGSTYSPENDAVFDGISRPGVRLVSFAPILKHGIFPLAEILRMLLEISERSTGGPVEIEFAANVGVPPGQPAEFAFLQLRPLALARELADLDLGRYQASALVCQSDSVLGHGRIDMHDVVVVDSPRFSTARSREIAAEIGRLNARFVDAEVPYVLIVVGRLGSHEPTLGLPVTWDQIAGAQVIVEAGFHDFKVTPSQGSHFFQHLVTRSIGYFTVNPDARGGFVDWAWLAAQSAASDLSGVRHLRFASPVVVKMNGKERRGVIVKPAR
jgi:CheY-like chemotaxis protein